MVYFGKHMQFKFVNYEYKRKGLKKKKASISRGEGNGTPLQYSCLENPKDRGAWWATVHGLSKSQT